VAALIADESEQRLGIFEQQVPQIAEILPREGARLLLYGRRET